MPEPNTYMFDTEGFSADLMEGGWKGGVRFNAHIPSASAVQILLGNVREHNRRGRGHGAGPGSGDGACVTSGGRAAAGASGGPSPQPGTSGLQEKAAAPPGASAGSVRSDVKRSAKVIKRRLGELTGALPAF